MNTNLLLTASAASLALLGGLLTFAPQEVLAHSGAMAGDPVVVLLAQEAGALCLGFAMLNWMARGSLIGGIYNRPIALGNFLHFAVVAMALVKVMLAGVPLAPPVMAGGVVYTIFAASFGVVLFTHPRPANGTSRS